MLKDQVLLDILPVNESIFFWPDASESLLPHKDPLSKIHNCPKDLILQPTELNFESFPFKKGRFGQFL